MSQEYKSNKNIKKNDAIDNLLQGECGTKEWIDFFDRCNMDYETRRVIARDLTILDLEYKYKFRVSKVAEYEASPVLMTADCVKLYVALIKDTGYKGNLRSYMKNLHKIQLTKPKKQKNNIKINH